MFGGWARALTLMAERRISMMSQLPRRPRLPAFTSHEAAEAEAEAEAARPTLSASQLPVARGPIRFGPDSRRAGLQTSRTGHLGLVAVGG